MIIRTTSPSSGRQGVAIEAQDDRLLPQLERWIGMIQQRTEEGDAPEVDRLVLLDGWPFLPVAHEAEVRLHALDPSTAADAPPRYLPVVDVIARLSWRQRDLAERYGAAPPFDPPNYLARVSVCPRQDPRLASDGRYLLARTPPHTPMASGWVLRCGHPGCTTRLASNRKHVPDDAWKELTIADLARIRPSLVRYLALPQGFVVDRDHAADAKIGRRVEKGIVDTVPLETNVAAFDLPWSFMVPIEPTRAEEPALGSEVPQLRWVEDAAVLRAWSKDDAIRLLADRYGVDGATAAAALAPYLSTAGRLSLLHTQFPELDAEAFAAAVAILRRTDGTRARAYQDAGRKLREATGRPFADLMRIAERIDAELEHVDKVPRA